MLKAIARKILKSDLDADSQYIERLEESEAKLMEDQERLNQVANSLKEALAERPESIAKEYKFVPQTLTAEEQRIIGDSAETEVVELIGKWMKSKADQNADLLIHSYAKSSDEQKSLYRLAVLAWEDWFMFLENCKKMK